LVKLESNRFVNGKRVEEPNPDDTIDALNGLGYEVVDMKNMDNVNNTIQDDEKPVKKESIKKLSGGRNKPNYNKETMDLKKSILLVKYSLFMVKFYIQKIIEMPIQNIFKALMDPNHEYVKNLPNEYDPKAITQHRVQLDSDKFGSFDIFITNINENESDIDDKNDPNYKKKY
jgi:hypothetical protein